MVLFFWICLGIIFYTFIGYGIVLFCLIRAKTLFGRKSVISCNHHEAVLPSCSIVIAAYNEEHYIRDKILNTLSLSYPTELQIIIVADGSTDKTVQIIDEFPQINLLYDHARNGKINAINRAMKFIETEIVIFTDANAFLNKQAIIKICRHYADQKVGGVAGEKRIYIDNKADASTTGESFYWKYESKLKQWDSEFHSTIGAAGELFSIRRELYKPVHEDTILDDFMISMNIARVGYRIVYEPEAYASESASLDVKEELKRKVRIAAGGIQSVLKLKSLLNPIKYPLLGFQYFSHRVLRWSITPFLLIVVFILNIQLQVESELLLYDFLSFFQITFYSLAILGSVLEKRQLKLNIAFIPYYFCVMNYAVIIGIFKYFRNKQSSMWEKAERKEINNQIAKKNPISQF